MALLATPTSLAEFIVVEPALLIVAEGDVPEKLNAHQGTRNDSAFIDVLAVVIRIGGDLNIRDPPHLDLAEQRDHLVEAPLEVGRQSFRAQHGEQLVCQGVAATLYAIECGHVAVIDRVHLLQPIEAGIDGARVPSEDIGLVLGIDLVTGFIEAPPKEIANAADDGVLEGLEHGDVDRCGDQTGARHLRIQKPFPRLPDLGVYAVLLVWLTLRIRRGVRARQTGRPRCFHRRLDPEVSAGVAQFSRPSGARLSANLQPLLKWVFHPATSAEGGLAPEDIIPFRPPTIYSTPNT